MIAPTDPVPPLPRLRHDQPVRIVDAKRRGLLHLDGRPCRIIWPERAHARGEGPKVAVRGYFDAFAVDTPRHRGELVVEPL